MITITVTLVSYLYDLIYASYYSASIHYHSKSLVHAPIIYRNYRSHH